MIKECEKFLKYWQVKLELSDWEFQLILQDTLEIAGKVEFSPVAKRGIIRINPNVNSWLNKDEDIEFVILHELLHIVTNDILSDKCTDDTLYFDAKERLMNTLASALMREKYEGKHNADSKKTSKKK